MKHLELSGPCLSLHGQSSALGRAQHIPALWLQALVQIRKQTVQVGLTFSAAGKAGGWRQERERLIAKEALSLKLQRENSEQC